jgi:peptidyl-tRNA hydrolase, PTH1 family
MISIDLSTSPTSKSTLIIGLGNPGKEYAFTRHNAGFLFLDFFLAMLETKGFEIMKQEQKDYSKFFVPDLNLFLLKPKTFMNLSGTAVKKFLDYTREITRIIVVHDDLDINIGEFKVSDKKGPKLHNGINSLEEELKTSDFTRIRIGIENRKGIPIPGLDYVLYDFAPEELQLLEQTFTTIIEQYFKFNA